MKDIIIRSIYTIIFLNTAVISFLARRRSPVRTHKYTVPVLSADFDIGNKKGKIYNLTIMINVSVKRDGFMIDSCRNTCAF